MKRKFKFCILKLQQGSRYKYKYIYQNCKNECQREPFGLKLEGVSQIDLSVLVLRRILQGVLQVLDGALVAVCNCVSGEEKANLCESGWRSH